MARHGTAGVPLVVRKRGEDALSARLVDLSGRFFAVPVDLAAALEADPGRTLDALATDPSSIAPLRERPGSAAYCRLHSRLLKDSLRLVQGLVLAAKLADVRRHR